MSVKISELPILDSLADNDVLAGVDTSANVTKKIELATLKDYIDTNTTYTAGTNIDITNNVVSAPNVYNKTETDELLGEKDEEILDLQEQIDELSTIYNAFPTASGEGESVSLDGTSETKFKKIDLKGNTSQTGTPTPSSPIPVNVVSGNNSVVIQGLNYFSPQKAITDSNNAETYITQDGDWIRFKTGGTRFYFYPVGVKANTQYSFKAILKSGDSTNNTIEIDAFYTDGTDSMLVKYSSTDTNEHVLVGTTTSGKTLSYLRSSNTSNKEAFIKIDGTELVEGSYTSETIPPYQPYSGNTYPINLPEGMELCKIGNYQDYFWHYKVNSKLPNDYTQVEYIESSGTQYIDTGISPTLSTGVDIKASLTTENNTDKILFGSRVGQNRFWFDFDGNQSPPYFMYGYGSYNSAGNYSLNTIYDISYNYNGTKVLKINNNTYNMTTTPPDLTNSEPIYLFRANYSNAFAGNFKIYECKIYDGTTLVRDFIPCIRNNDNKVGMYDLVNNVFYTNQGTGEFTYGKVNGNWYLHKEILKETMSTLSWIRLSNGSFYVNNFTTDYNCLSGYGLSNLWGYSSTTWTSGKFGIASSGALWVATGDSSLDTTAKFVTLLSNGNGILYGVLSTPTDTEILYQPLIEQLNNLEKAMSKQGQTNISQVSNDKPFIISAEAIASLQNVLDRIELLES